jgi:redox-sensitive bicupin YhaK (pirin superfamily)
MHSEFNPSKDQPVHFLQIWIQPDQQRIEPSYEEKRFSNDEKRGRLRVIASPNRADGSVLIHQDATVYAGLFNGDEQAVLKVNRGRRVYVHVARGSLVANGTKLAAGDALKLSEATELTLNAGQEAEVIVFDLPGE